MSTKSLILGGLRLLVAMPFFSFSSLKSTLYRMLGAKIGTQVKFGSGAFIQVYDFKRLTIGDGVEFGRNVRISCDAIEIGDDTRVSHGVVAVGPSALKVGRSCYLAPKVYIDLNEAVIIEDDVGIGADYIFTHSVWHPVTEGGPRKFAPVHLKKGAWIPAGVFIMPGVTIGERATVGARSLVIDDVPDGCLAVGVPARVVKTAAENFTQVSSEQKDRLVRGIIDEYLKVMGKSTRITENRHADGDLEVIEIESRGKGFLKRTNSLVLVYTSQVLDDSLLEHLRAFCRRFNSVLLVSLGPIPQGILDTFRASELKNMVWFSIASKVRRKSWNPDAVALHNFFRSHYGIRFKFYQA
ncbi:MAG TPA: hypothetical protein VJ249_02865 [Candidatus Bathyarchaeia archaeon]|nr:hypothetical protein [Candidatus Bathyarchaeia archaeon]